MTAVLIAEGVRKSCGRHRVLCGADLTVQTEQLVAVVGEWAFGSYFLP